MHVDSGVIIGVLGGARIGLLQEFGNYGDTFQPIIEIIQRVIYILSLIRQVATGMRPITVNIAAACSDLVYQGLF